MGDESYSERILRLAYERAGDSYEAISEFRAKLLALLPLATGTGAFLLLENGQKAGTRGFLAPIGIFGVVVTLGLFMYELRGVQRCHRLEAQLRTLEKQLGLSANQGPFLGQPPRKLRNMLGPPAAGLIVYSSTAFTWLWLAGYGLGNFVDISVTMAWTLSLVGYGVLLIGGWVWLSRWLRGDRPTVWRSIEIELPPIDPKYIFDKKVDAAKTKAAGLASELTALTKAGEEESRKQDLVAQLDKAEKEYLQRLHEMFLDDRVPVAKRNQ